MHKIRILDENSGNFLKKKNKQTIMKINDNLLELGLRKGLIEKDRGGFFFIGNYEKFLVFKNEKIVS